ncbi:MAG TPA: hypothetical protein VNK96_01630 [Fimbriimonadales bacterium]|nr:hypothetical protein [Fimbriimonadales bacterium]
MSCSWVIVTALLFTPNTFSEPNTEKSAEYDVYFGEAHVGELRYKITLKENKALQTQIRSEYSFQDFQQTNVQENEYDFEGRPIRKYLRTTGDSERTIIASFGKDSVHIVREEKGKRSTQTIPIPKGAEIRAKSEFWFLTVTPRIGKQYEYYRFDLTNLLWHKIRAVYSGKETIRVGKKDVVAHAITQTDLEGKVSIHEIKLWLDDNGVPLLMVSEKMRVERKSK